MQFWVGLINTQRTTLMPVLLLAPFPLAKPLPVPVPAPTPTLQNGLGDLPNGVDATVSRRSI